MPYTDDPTNNPIDRIRLNVGDTDLYDEGLSDNIYTYLLTKYDSNEGQSSLEALKMLVNKYASYVDEKAGDLSTKDSQRYNQYRELLEKATKDPTQSFLKTGNPYVGGISLQDRLSNPSSNPFRITNPLSCNNRVY